MKTVISKNIVKIRSSAHDVLFFEFTDLYLYLITNKKQQM